MKVFITGGLGYVGSALSKHLIESKIASEVTIYDNCSGSSQSFLINQSLKQIKIIKGDILDSRTLKKSMAGHDAVVHLAEAKDNNQGHFLEQINHWGAAEVGYAIESLGINNLVFLSSTKVYPYVTTDSVITDINNVAPTTAYGSSKLRGEAHFERFINKKNTNAHIVRAASVYGYSPSLSFDSFLNKLIFDANYFNRLELFGSGFQFRTFVHIDNVVSTISNLLLKNNPSAIHNISDINVSIIDIIDSLKEVYPEMEFIFASHHLTLPHIRVNSSESVTPFIVNKKTLTEQIQDIKSHFSF